MSSLAIKFEPLAVEVGFTRTMLRVVLADVREISSPLVWFPRLLSATPEQRRNWRLIGGGIFNHYVATLGQEPAETRVTMSVTSPKT